MNNPDDLLHKKMLYVLHWAFVNIRNQALAEGNEKLAALADTFEIIPTLLANWDDQHLDLIRQILGDFQRKNADNAPTYDFLSVLEMDDAKFREIYGQGW